MNLYDCNEMFIIALVALSIVGVVCLGLVVVLAIFVLGQRRDKGQLSNNPPNIGSSLQKDTGQINQPQNIIERLDKTDKEIGLGTSIGIWGLALVVLIYSRDVILGNILQGVAGFVLALVLLILGYPKVRKHIIKSPKLAWRCLWFILGIVITLSVLSIFFIYPLLHSPS
jgi:hypothetical protein